MVAGIKGLQEEWDTSMSKCLCFVHMGCELSPRGGCVDFIALCSTVERPCRRPFTALAYRHTESLNCMITSMHHTTVVTPANNTGIHSKGVFIGIYGKPVLNWSGLASRIHTA